MTDYISQGFCADCLHPAASAIPTLHVGPDASDAAPPQVSGGPKGRGRAMAGGVGAGRRANVRAAVSPGRGAELGAARRGGWAPPLLSSAVICRESIAGEADAHDPPPRPAQPRRPCDKGPGDHHKLLLHYKNPGKSCFVRYQNKPIMIPVLGKSNTTVVP